VNGLLANVTFVLPDAAYTTRGIRIQLRGLACGEVCECVS
jgi:hypothetical protein